MRFMMFVATDSDSAPDTICHKPAGADEWIAEVGESHITGNRLRPTTDAKTVRVRDGNLIVTDGPFAESKEAIVGFDILECASLEEAIEIASKHPLATTGRLELRAFWPFDV